MFTGKKFTMLLLVLTVVVGLSACNLFEGPSPEYQLTVSLKEATENGDGEPVQGDIKLKHEGEVLESVEDESSVNWELKNDTYTVEATAYGQTKEQEVVVDGEDEIVSLAFELDSIITVNLEDQYGGTIEGDVEVREDGEVIESGTGEEVKFNLKDGTYDLVATSYEKEIQESLEVQGQDEEVTMTFELDIMQDLAASYFDFEENLEDQTGNMGSGYGVTNYDDEEETAEVTYEEGINGQAVYIEETGIRLPDNLIADDYSYTVAHWVNMTNMPDWTPSFFAQNNDNFTGFMLNTDWENKAHLRAHNGEEDLWDDRDTGYVLSTGEWTHIVYTVDQGDLTMYINGEVVYEGTDYLDVFDSEQVEFALGISPFDEPLTGKLDELVIFDRAVAAEVVTDLYEVNY